MALQENISTVSYVAEGAIKQYRLVKHGANERGCAAAAAGDTAFGVCINAPMDAGHAATIVIGGIAKVEAGGAITVGQKVIPGADGVGMGQTGGTAASIGVAITAAGAAGEIVEVQLA